jgi:hypothetical protein
VAASAALARTPIISSRALALVVEVSEAQIQQLVVGFLSLCALCMFISMVYSPSIDVLRRDASIIELTTFVLQALAPQALASAAPQPIPAAVSSETQARLVAALDLEVRPLPFSRFLPSIAYDAWAEQVRREYTPKRGYSASSPAQARLLWRAHSLCHDLKTSCGIWTLPHPA